MGDNDVMMHVTLPNTHLQDCPLSQPCIVEWRRADLIDDTHPHRVVSGSGGACVECDEASGGCICERLWAHGKRVLTEAREVVAAEWCSPRARHADGECDWCTAHRADLAAIDRLIEAGP